MRTSSPAAADARPSDLTRLAGVALRNRWWILAAAALLLSLRAIGHGHGDWDFFVGASRRLLDERATGWDGPGGFHLYASHPDVVTGPATLLVVRALALLGTTAGYAAGVVVANLLAVVGIAFVEQAAADRDQARPATTLLGGLVVLVAWSELAAYGHLDDAFALVAVSVALWAVGRGEPITVGLALGAAIATKQWGIVFLPLALALPGRDRVRAGAIAIGLGALVWLPFVIAAPGMLTQRSLVQIVADDSLFGVIDYGSLQGPTWVRAAQIGAGLVLVALCVWRRRWPAAILVAMAARVILDPATWTYYTAAVVFGAFVWDMVGTRRLLPVWATAEFLLLAEATLLVDDPQLRGILRILACGAAFATMLGPSGPERARAGVGTGSEPPPG